MSQIQISNDTRDVIITLVVAGTIGCAVLFAMLSWEQGLKNELLELSDMSCEEVNMKIAESDFSTPLNVIKAERYYDRICDIK